METKISESGLTFNIIFTPGTVKCMRVFTLSLLERLRCSFRLVANGLDGNEIEMLEQFCSSRSRLEFLLLPGSKKIKHDRALNYLQQLETSAYFCFMDSDIFAAGNFLRPLLPLLDNCCAVFSGRPAWQESEETVLPRGSRRVIGRYIRTADGIMLGCSYFAIYNNKKLSGFIETSGLTFQKYNWQDIPPRYRTRLEKMGLKADYYDTGKVLNIFLGEEGEKLVYEEPDDLFHLGGYSTLTGVSTRSWSTGNISAAREQAIVNMMEKELPVDTKRKRKATRFFIELLHALFEGRPLPDLPQFDSIGVLQTVSDMKERILGAYTEFREQL